MDIQVNAGDSPFFFGWMIDNSKILDGEIEFLDNKNDVIKILSFQNAYCVDYNEEYAKAENGVITIEHIRLSCKKVEQKIPRFIQTYG